jgi:hypothetical protein
VAHELCVLPGLGFYRLRSGFLRGRLNEQIYKRYFKAVFEDKENRFGALTIYRVPDRVREDAGSKGH